MGYLLGQPVRIGPETLTVAGTPTDATMTLTVTLPDGTTTSPAITHAGTGVYQADYLPPQTGAYTYRWAATGAATSAAAGVFFVAADVTWLSLDEVKAALNYDTGDTSDDTEILPFIQAACDWVEQKVGRILVTTYTHVVRDVARNGAIVVPEYPIQTVTAVTGWLPNAFGSPGYPISLTALDVDTQGGVIRSLNGLNWVTPFTVTYTAGLGTLPGPVRQATLDLIKYRWSRSQQQAFGGTDYDATVQQGPDVGVPYAILTQLQPYMRETGFA